MKKAQIRDIFPGKWPTTFSQTNATATGPLSFSSPSHAGALPRWQSPLFHVNMVASHAPLQLVHGHYTRVKNFREGPQTTIIFEHENLKHENFKPLKINFPIYGMW